jgi:signal transduction histidine kinase
VRALTESSRSHCLWADPFNAEERDLLNDLAEHGARAARVMCLATELSAARQSLVESREQERSRLRHDLHDDLGPILAGLAMQLGSLPHSVESDADLARARLGQLETQALAALERTRQISRDLRPPALDELGLTNALIEAGRALGVQVIVQGSLPAELSPAVEVAVYRIAAEALVNAQRHAGADEICLRFDQSSELLQVDISDAGMGMAPGPDGVGLRSMRERASELGGSVKFLPSAGGGVTVRATFPNPANGVLV